MGILLALAVVVVVLVVMMVRVVRNFPSPQEVYDSLSHETLTSYQYTADHLQTASVNQQPPRSFMGNSLVKVAYWYTKHSEDDWAETIAFFHAKKTGRVIATLRNGKLIEWTYGGAKGRPLSDADMDYFPRVLGVVRSFSFPGNKLSLGLKN